jgi:hypothetical protein
MNNEIKWTRYLETQEAINAYLNDRGISIPESRIVMALGLNGFVSELDGNKVCFRSWTYRDENGYKLTEGVRGMKFKDLALETEIVLGRLSPILKALAKKEYLFKMSAYTSRHLMNDLRLKEAVLTRQGTRLYEGLASCL